jgi:hypothetical protein
LRESVDEVLTDQDATGDTLIVAIPCLEKCQSLILLDTFVGCHPHLSGRVCGSQGDLQSVAVEITNSHLVRMSRASFQGLIPIGLRWPAGRGLLVTYICFSSPWPGVPRQSHTGRRGHRKDFRKANGDCGGHRLAESGVHANPPCCIRGGPQVGMGKCLGVPDCTRRRLSQEFGHSKAEITLERH